MKLIIDNHEILLEDGFSTEYIQENPLFTKNGSYTLNIDIPLNFPQNLEAFSFISRKDISSYPKGRKAFLWNGSELLLTGTEVILSVEDRIVSIQIISDNSELNYITSERNIRDLNFGSMPGVEQGYTVTSDIYPTVNVQFPSCVSKRPSGDLKRTLIYDEHNKLFDGKLRVPIDGSRGVRGGLVRPFPFLLYYIEKLIELLGYNLKVNELRENELACRILVTNEYANWYLRYRFNDMLPDWTVTEFITNIENFFNCIFVKNENDNSISILNIKRYLETQSSTHYIDNSSVIGDIDKEFDSDGFTAHNYVNVKYDLPNSKFYKYADIDDEILEYDLTPKPDTQYPGTLCNQNTISSRYLFTNAETQWMMRTIGDGDEFFSCLIMQHQHIINNKQDDSFTELKIVPSPIGYLLDEAGDYKTCILSDEMDIDGESKADAVHEGNTINQLIENGIPDKNLYNSIFIAIYEGLHLDFRKNGTATHTAAMAKTVNEHFFPGKNLDGFLMQFNDPQNTLSLDGSYGLYNTLYKNTLSADLTTRYTIRFIWNGSDKLDPKNFFVIGNKKYICEQLKFIINDNGISDEVEGYFFLCN